MGLTRNLSLGASGPDVLAVKKRLLELGCYTPEITRLTRDAFGADTRRAVLAFQAKNGLVVDGIVGAETYALLFPAEAAAKQEPFGAALSAHLPDDAAGKIGEALATETQFRRAIVLDALAFAASPDAPGNYPRSLYIRGGNLYNADLSPNVISLARIASGAARQPEFYNGGRREMMERAVGANPTITGADCSGGIVGLLRHAKVVSARFDCSADGFWNGSGTTRIERGSLRPGDFLHKAGHIGLYVGDGFAVEWMGGAYGCQLTSLAKRRGWNYVKRKLDNCGAWTGFLRPKYDQE